MGARPSFRPGALALLILLGAAASACGRTGPIDPAPTADPKGTIFVFSDLRGTLKPCGCSPDLRRGGLDRVAEVLRRARESTPTGLVLHAGDLLLDDEGIPDVLRAQIDRRLIAFADALTSMRVDAVGLGPNDLQQPEWLAAALPKLSVPVIVTNAPPSAPWGAHVRRSLLVQSGPLKVGIIGLVPGGAAGATDPLAAAQTEAQALRAQGAQVVIALSSLGLRAAKRLARGGLGVDVMVAAGQGLDAVVTDEVEPIGPEPRPTFVLQSFVQGGQVGRIDIDLAGDGLSLYDPDAPPATGGQLRYTLTPVNWDLPRDAAVASIMDRFDADLEAVNLKAAGDPIPPVAGQPTYVGVEKCYECHEATRAWYEKDQHYLAWETIENDKKTFDVYCVSCHVTGFMRPGGSSLKALEGLKDVQCESCHGPGSAHAETGDIALIQRSPTESSCKTCHNPKHSTRFEFEAYRERLIAPGHGLPLDGAKAP